MSTRTRFEKEAKGNSEMAYSGRFHKELLRDIESVTVTL